MNEYSMTTGLDLGDKYSVWVTVDAAGEKIGSGKVRTNKESLCKMLEGQAKRLVVLEAGAHSPWVSETVASLGHEVVVADPRRLPLISQSDRKNDRNDAEWLARLGRADVKLLAPVTHRGGQAQMDLAVLKARDGLVKARTQIVNQVRSLIKLTGERAPKSSPEAFADKVRPLVPAGLRAAVTGLLDVLDELNEQIARYDEQIEWLGKKRYPATDLIREIKGVGPITSLAFVLVLEDPKRFAKSREVGPYLGLTRREDASGESDPSLGITKAGNGYLRRLLVQSAQYILGHHGPDCDLRRWGLKLAGPVDAKGKHNKRQKKRAVVATARKLAVLLHHLWVNGVVYDPFYQEKQQPARKKEPAKKQKKQKKQPPRRREVA